MVASDTLPARYELERQRESDTAHRESRRRVLKGKNPREHAIYPLHFLNTDTVERCQYIVSMVHTNLLVIEAGCEREHAGAWIQGENVVGPVGDEGVAELAVGPVGVGVRRHHLTDPTAPRHVLRHVERVRRALERRRVVVCVCHLKNPEILLLLIAGSSLTHR